MALKLEVGKVYVDQAGILRKVIADNFYETQDGVKFNYLTLAYDKESDTIHINRSGWQNVNAEGVSPGKSVRLVKEYREPVVHRRIVWWYREANGILRTVTLDVTDVNLKFLRDRYNPLKEIEVEFSEE